jgi:hypothetical protein
MKLHELGQRFACSILPSSFRQKTASPARTPIHAFPSHSSWIHDTDCRFATKPALSNTVYVDFDPSLLVSLSKQRPDICRVPVKLIPDVCSGTAGLLIDVSVQRIEEFCEKNQTDGSRIIIKRLEEFVR